MLADSSNNVLTGVRAARVRLILSCEAYMTAPMIEVGRREAAEQQSRRCPMTALTHNQEEVGRQRLGSLLPLCSPSESCASRLNIAALRRLGVAFLGILAWRLRGRLLNGWNFPAAGESRHTAFGIEHWPRSWLEVGGFRKSEMIWLRNALQCSTD